MDIIRSRNTLDSRVSSAVASLPNIFSISSLVTDMLFEPSVEATVESELYIWE